MGKTHVKHRFVCAEKTGNHRHQIDCQGSLCIRVPALGGAIQVDYFHLLVHGPSQKIDTKPLPEALEAIYAKYIIGPSQLHKELIRTGIIGRFL